MALLPTFYCINLPSSNDRKARMALRFAQLPYTHYRFIDGVDKDSKLVSHLKENLPIDYIKTHYRNNIDLLNRDIACFSAHLNAIKEFVFSGEPSCFICEDDTLFHNDFYNLFHRVMRQLPHGIELVTFCYMLSGAIDRTVINDHFYRIHPDVTWSGNLYWMTRKYALSLIVEYDKVFATIIGKRGNEKITSEHFIRFSGGLMTTFPFAIEDGINSCRAPEDLPFHLRHYCKWGYTNYSLGDPQGLSPLKEVKEETAWKAYKHSIKETEGKQIRLMTPDEYHRQKWTIRIGKALIVLAIGYLVYHYA